MENTEGIPVPRPLMKYEPTAIVTSTMALIGAAFVLARVIFPDAISDDLQEAIEGFLVIALPILVGLIVRGKVTPNAAVVERADVLTGEVVAGEANNQVAEAQFIRYLDDEQRD